MFKPLKFKVLAAAAGACVALLAAAPANAYVYALSHLEIANLSLSVSGANVSTTVNGFSFDLTNTATLNGNSAIQSASCNNFSCNAASPVLDPLPANAGGSTLLRSNNNFAFLGVNGVDSYSGADSVLTNAELVQGVPTNLQQIAESLLNTNGSARANSEIQSNTSLNISFTVAGPGSANLDLSFAADPDQRAEINGMIGNYLAQSNMNASITLRKAGAGPLNFVTWSPAGTLANDCLAILTGSACSETFDNANLNFNTSTATNPDTADNSFEAAQTLENFGIQITGLTAGNYTIALNSLTSTSITRNVPEPGSLALIGLALAGLGFGASRRQAKRA